jgi:hypothetical protein
MRPYRRWAVVLFPDPHRIEDGCCRVVDTDDRTLTIRAATHADLQWTQDPKLFAVVEIPDCPPGFFLPKYNTFPTAEEAEEDCERQAMAMGFDA